MLNSEALEKPATVYVTRNGLLEPLGQSQVMGYLRGLSRDYRITLITYEKSEDWVNLEKMERARELCLVYGIRWIPQRFKSHPKGIAPALSMLRMVWLIRREVVGQRAQLIHARSYIPAAVAMCVAASTKVPFVFDMRALWPEELIAAGRLGRGSLLHRAIVAAEKVCLRRAGAVVSLTHVAIDHLKRIYPESTAHQTFVVIPTCADLERFVPADRPPERRVIGCLGTVLSGWFKVDWLASFLEVAADRAPEAIFEMTTRDDPIYIRKKLDPNAILNDRLRIAASAPDDVHHVLQLQTVSVMFFTDGLSKLGSSPTRMAEILGCGLPVVANDGVGDVARIIREYRVGVLATGPERESMTRVWDEMVELLRDPELAHRCRKAAQDVFSLEAGTAEYKRLYSTLIEGIGRKVG